MDKDYIYFIVFILLIFFAVAYIFGYICYLIFKTAVAIRRKRFFTALLRGLETETIKTLEDVFLVYSGVAGRSYELDESKYYIGNELRKFLVNLLTADSYIFQKHTVVLPVKQQKS